MKKCISALLATVLLLSLVSFSSFSVSKPFFVNAVTGETTVDEPVAEESSETSEDMDIAISDIFDSGNGSNSDPYIIMTAEQLFDFASIVNGGYDFWGEYIELGADIPLNDTSTADWTSAAVQWTPIGTDTAKFKGDFYGAGHTVSGIYIDTSMDDQGFFGCANGAYIRNVKISDSYINAGVNVGGIVGRGISCYVAYCSSSATVIGTQKVGGIVGYCESLMCTVRDCINYGSVSASDTSYSYVGGIVGEAPYSCDEIYNCINVGQISDEGYYCGSIAGYNYGATENCYYNYSILSAAIANSDPHGGISDMYKLTDSQLKLQSSFEGLDFYNVWAMDAESGYPAIDYNENLRFLNFALSEDGTYYSVSSSPNAAGEVIIPSVYNGLPVKVIGESAFRDCSGLTSIEIPDSVTTIGISAFAWCTSVTDITIPDSVTTIGISVFAWCTSVTDITIPDSVTTIGDSAFYGCTGLTSVTIGDSVATIGESAFRDCTGLTSIEIPDSVISIEYSAFDGCTGLKSITIGNSITTISAYAFEGCSHLETVIIGNSVTTIGNYAFRDCTGLTSIEIPDSVATIGESAFRGCTGLTNIEIPDSVTTIEGWAFCGCTGLTNAIIGNSVAKIGGSVFGGCTSLTNVEIPDSLTTIEFSSFYGCTSLASITIPDSVTTINYCAFYDCANLTSVTLPVSLTEIGDNAFDGCTQLTSVHIPESVQTMGDWVFDECDSLTDIYCDALEKPEGWSDSWHGYEPATIHWGNVIYNIEEGAGVTFENNGAFAPGTVVTAKKLPVENNTVTIGNENYTLGNVFGDTMSAKVISAYDFNAEKDGKKAEANGKIRLNIKTDPGSGKGNKGLVYVNTETGYKELIKSEYDKNTGNLTAELDHFSIYVVVEYEESLLGDINANGEIDSLDYILLKRAYFGTYSLDETSKTVGDINKNGEIDSLDYILLKRAYFGTYEI